MGFPYELFPSTAKEIQKMTPLMQGGNQDADLAAQQIALRPVEPTDILMTFPDPVLLRLHDITKRKYRMQKEKMNSLDMCCWRTPEGKIILQETTGRTL